jgi:hypothetical protein
MRHFFGYDINGSLRSIETYGPAGWPKDHCLINPACNKAAVLSLKEDRAGKNPDIVGWVLFDCGCDVAAGRLVRDCKCVTNRFSNSYVDMTVKTLKPKPTRSVYIDGVLINDKDVVTKNPGAAIKLKIVSADMETGQIVECGQKGPVDVAPEATWQMTFSSGETEEKTLTAPAQGTKAVVFMAGTRVRPFMFTLRGFVSA